MTLKSTDVVIHLEYSKKTTMRFSEIDHFDVTLFCHKHETADLHPRCFPFDFAVNV